MDPQWTALGNDYNQVIHSFSLLPPLPPSTLCPTQTQICVRHTHTHLPHPTPLPSEDRLSAAVAVSADSLLSFSADRDPLQVGWWPEWGVGGIGERLLGRAVQFRRTRMHLRSLVEVVGEGGQLRTVPLRHDAACLV